MLITKCFGLSVCTSLLALCVGLSLGACKSDDDDDSGGMAGSGAAAGTKASAPIAGFMGGTVTGTAAFTQTGTDVTVVVSLTNCPDGEHPVHIHEGTSCADAMAQGGHWGAPMMTAGSGGMTASAMPVRGEGIPNVVCAGGTGTVMLTRTPVMPDLAWTVGADPATNVIGHAFVVHNADMAKTRIGCGVIAAAQ